MTFEFETTWQIGDGQNIPPPKQMIPIKMI